MSVQTQRGGVVQIRRETVDATGRQYDFAFTTLHVQIRNEGANPLRIFTTQVDFDNDDNYIEVPAASASSQGLWEGPQETKGLLLKSPVGTTAVLVGYQRRA